MISLGTAPTHGKSVKGTCEKALCLSLFLSPSLYVYIYTYMCVYVYIYICIYLYIVIIIQLRMSGGPMFSGGELALEKKAFRPEVSKHCSSLLLDDDALNLHPYGSNRFG